MNLEAWTWLADVHATTTLECFNSVLLVFGSGSSGCSFFVFLGVPSLNFHERASSMIPLLGFDAVLVGLRAMSLPRVSKALCAVIWCAF